MKKLVCLFILPALLISCQPKEKIADAAEPATDTVSKTPVVMAVKKDARKIGPEKSAEQMMIDVALEKMTSNTSDPGVGYWVGMFGKNKINIAIAEAKEGKALGYTVCAGNYRPITGTVKVADGVYSFDMNEPGTDKYDGHFEFSIEVKKNLLKGTWKPFKKGVVGDKEYTLARTNYTYQPALGKYPDASTRLLTESDVENMSAEELEFMRNEIYARHGYSFKDLDDRRQFDVIDWYIPMGIDIREKLTDIEVQNIDLIYRYEEYYTESYDDYGR
jgi:YARHG domain